MNIHTIWIKYDRTFDLGKTNEINLACTLQADVDKNDNFVDVIADLQAIARLSVKREFARLSNFSPQQESHGDTTFMPTKDNTID